MQNVIERIAHFADMGLSNPGRDQSRPLLAAKRHVLHKVIRPRDKVAPDVVHVIFVLHEKESRHLANEAISDMFLFPPNLAELFVLEPSENHRLLITCHEALSTLKCLKILLAQSSGEKSGEQQKTSRYTLPSSGYVCALK